MRLIELKRLVIMEALKLKEKATPEELSKLDFEELEPMSSSLCIYGQMTGDCFSNRALDLLISCAKPLSRSLRFEKFDRHVPKSVDWQDCTNPTYETRSAFSPIEVYIYLREEGNKNLIDFLKGDKKTLTLEDL